MDKVSSSSLSPILSIFEISKFSSDVDVKNFSSDLTRILHVNDIPNIRPKLLIRQLEGSCLLL